ncbi:N-acetylglutamate synthase-like GNAT family acetyltransferase [Pontibacter aydingkolensis]|uniref:GNAT family N-acetyltransferase n=1 Tax=Pontibacter aydingkolensis TaxID=1911536 RepID=A0ABS7CZS3_9BACT|nr:GNAT family N-acetyltransferase [Pontibacter aydingkolensis]MBW7469364.1 GNAT family N-acetyltransferase [Pontibacter aydingkolensis]
MIRLYTEKDKVEVIELLRLNTPLYFAPEEESDLIHYLNHEIEDYFVVEENGRIVGSGGINYFPDAGLTRISWDIIHPEFQGKGIGKKLLLHRIAKIKSNPSINLIQVRTTQLVYKFYGKAGFRLETTEKDFWAKGLDLYQMKLALH